MKRDKFIKVRVSESEKRHFKLISELSGDDMSDIIRKGFKAKETNVIYDLKHSKHWAIFNIMATISICFDWRDDESRGIFSFMDISLHESMHNLAPTNNHDPLQTEVNLPAIIAEFDKFLEKDITFIKDGDQTSDYIYNIIGDLLNEWDEVKNEWNL